MTECAFSALVFGLAEQNGLSKRGLADQASLSNAVLSDLVNGKVELLPLSAISGLAAALDVPPLELLKPYFRSLDQAEQSSSSSHMDSTFVADITFPDNALVYPEQVFEKVWSVMNTGKTVWKDMYLECQDEVQMLEGIPLGLQPVNKRVSVPETAPGQKALIAVQLKAPALPCTTVSRWKAVDETGRLMFPDKFPLYCLVKVVGI